MKLVDIYEKYIVKFLIVFPLNIVILFCRRRGGFDKKGFSLGTVVFDF